MTEPNRDNPKALGYKWNRSGLRWHLFFLDPVYQEIDLEDAYLTHSQTAVCGRSRGTESWLLYPLSMLSGVREDQPT